MTSTPTLAGKRALVTGGSRGIGAAIVRRLASQGATVAVNYRSDRAAADALVGELTDQGWATLAFPGDVSDAAQTRELVGAVVSEFGGLELLVSNAGVEHFGALETITQADFDLLFQTNVAGQLFVTQAAVAAMTDGGRIALSSSVSVRLAVHHHALYAASKAAISAMVRNLAPELAGRNIAINAIAPGATATRMATRYAANYTHPALTDVPFEALIRSMSALGWLGQPDEIAAVVAFLLSPRRVLCHRHHHRSRRRLELTPCTHGRAAAPASCEAAPLLLGARLAETAGVQRKCSHSSENPAVSAVLLSRPIASSSASTSSDSREPAPAMFSRRCATEEVPGISRMFGERCSSQASATCIGVAPSRRPRRRASRTAAG